MIIDPISVTPALGNDAATVVLDSTVSFETRRTAPVRLTSVSVAVYPTGQAVTARMLYRVGSTMRVAETQSCPAGQLTAHTFTPAVAWFRIEILNGGTGPSALDVTAARKIDD